MRLIVLVALVCFVSGGVGGWLARSYAGRVKRLIQGPRRDHWAIGIYVGPSPLQFAPPAHLQNPVLTASDVTDVRAAFVADPFMVHEGETWYMFFEVMDTQSQLGVIGVATSPDGFAWRYRQIVLREPFHLSYPHVFKWQSEYYMVPESYLAHAIRLYRATNFPTEWSFVGTLLDGYDYVDSSLVHFGEQWWLFTSPTTSDTLCLYYANDLAGPWIEHPQSPIITGNKHIARLGGRVLPIDSQLIRYAQDDASSYGTRLRAFEIVELTPERYQEKPVPGNPVLSASGQGWNAHGMHQIDPHPLGQDLWIACVDGNRIERDGVLSGLALLLQDQDRPAHRQGTDPRGA